MNIRQSILTAGAILLLAVSLPALAGGPLHARVSADSGEALVRGKQDDDWSHAPVNTLILPGDTVWVDQEGAMEIEMSGGTFLRLADGSKAEIASLSPEVLVRGWTGSFYVQRLSRSSGDAAFATPAATIEVKPDSMVRVDVVGDGATTVSVRWGAAAVRTPADGLEVVREGRRVYVDPGLLPSEPVFYDRTAEDSFDIWNRDRARLLAVGENPLPRTAAKSQVPIGAHDLDVYGDWVYVDQTPYWRPTVVNNYVPYRSGHWSYVPTTGYVWVGSQPFCYVTSHYGRWMHHNSYGWLWSYQPEWAPAWVASFRCGPNYVWTPLDPWNRPVTYGTAVYRFGDITLSVTASSYAPVSVLHNGYAYGYAATPNIINQTIITTGDVTIWNIRRGGRPTYAPTHENDDRPILEVREYDPARVIRGPEAVGGKGSVRARARVAKLEHKSDVRSFTRARPDDVRSVRTSLANSTRSASARAAGVDRSFSRRTEQLTTRAVRSKEEVVLRGRGSGSDSARSRQTRELDRAFSGRELARQRTTGVARMRGEESPSSVRDRRSSDNANRAVSIRDGSPSQTRTPSVRDAASSRDRSAPARGNRGLGRSQVERSPERSQVERSVRQQQRTGPGAEEANRRSSSDTTSTNFRTRRLGDAPRNEAAQSPGRIERTPAPSVRTRELRAPQERSSSQDRSVRSLRSNSRQTVERPQNTVRTRAPEQTTRVAPPRVERQPIQTRPQTTRSEAPRREQRSFRTERQSSPRLQVRREPARSAPARIERPRSVEPPRRIEAPRVVERAPAPKPPSRPAPTRVEPPKISPAPQAPSSRPSIGSRASDRPSIDSRGSDRSRGISRGSVSRSRGMSSRDAGGSGNSGGFVRSRGR